MKATVSLFVAVISTLAAKGIMDAETIEKEILSPLESAYSGAKSIAGIEEPSPDDWEKFAGKEMLDTLRRRLSGDTGEIS